MAFQVNLPNEEAWSKEIASSQTGVIQVIEVYQDWCGPCKAVINTLKKQFFELGTQTFGNTSLKILSAGNGLTVSACKECWHSLQDGKLLNTVTGVNAPVLTTTVDKLSAEAAAAVAAKA